MSRIAVVLFNLGGPDGPDSVRPFLNNLFKDPAIIAAPALVRFPLAVAIAARREAAAKANYALMGGGSPLLSHTQDQAAALEDSLRDAAPQHDFRTFVAMRYWRPFTADATLKVQAFEPHEIVLTPLYPQYSTTTTGSSVREWMRVYRGEGRLRTICCYPDETGLVEAHAEAIAECWRAAGSPKKMRLLFSAHGLPEKVIASGDPYQAQVEATARAVAARLPEFRDWRVCYQSRVGPLKWIGPSTVQEIRRAAEDGLGVLVSPIAFVSEHVETLVELDREYARLAAQAGCAPYLRAPALNTSHVFIQGLTRSVLTALDRGEGAAPAGPWRCVGFSRCLRVKEAV